MLFVAAENQKTNHFDEKAAVTKFENFYNGRNSELKVFACTNGVNDIHKLDVSYVVTDSSMVAKFTDINHIECIKPISNKPTGIA